MSSSDLTRAIAQTVVTSFTAAAVVAWYMVLISIDEAARAREADILPILVTLAALPLIMALIYLFAGEGNSVERQIRVGMSVFGLVLSLLILSTATMPTPTLVPPVVSGPLMLVTWLAFTWQAHNS